MSDTNQVDLSFAEEAAWDEIPTAAFTGIRMTSESCSHGITNTESAEIRADRMISDLVQTAGAATAAFNFEASLGSPDDRLLEGAMWSTFGYGNVVSLDMTGDTVTIDDAAKTFTATTLDFSTIVGLKAGAQIIIEGFTNPANNGVCIIASVAASVLTVTGLTMYSDTATTGTMKIWGPVQKTFGATVTVTGATKTYTDSGNAMITTGIRPGMPLYVSGMLNPENNGPKVVKTVVAGSFTVEEYCVDEAVAVAMVINGVQDVQSGASDITVSTTSGNVTIYTSAAAINYVTSGFRVGQWIRVTGVTTAANGGLKKITAVTASVLTTVGKVAPAAGADAADIRFRGCMIRNGTTEHSYTFERYLQDAEYYYAYHGQACNTFGITVSSQSIVTGNMEFIGGNISDSDIGQVAYGTGTPIAPPVNDLFNAVTNVGHIWEGGSEINSGLVVKEVSFTLTNNVRGLDSVGSLGNKDIGVGMNSVSGNFNTLFLDATTYAKFLASEDTSLSFELTDGDGHSYVYTFHRIKFETGDSGMATGTNADVNDNYGWKSIRDTATVCQIQIDKLPA